MPRPLLLTALALGATAATTPALAQAAASGGDRYGPAPQGFAANASYGEAQAAPGAAPALRGRVLAWPGKVEAPVTNIPPRVAAQAYPSPSPARATFAVRPTPVRWTAPAPRVAAAQEMTPTALAGAPARAPTDGWRPVFARSAASPSAVSPTSAARAAAQAAPASIYAPPPNRSAAADRRYGYDPTQDHSVRFYSVARPFGLKPDPAPIPPQFFTATADLGGDPPGPLPVNHTTAAERAAVVGGDSGASQ
jgi:hypothetical protein